MSSCQIKYHRETFPNCSEEEVAKQMALKYGHVAVIRYKNNPDGDYTDFGCCLNDEEVQGYLRSRHCHDAEIIYDARSISVLITKQSILTCKCDICGVSPGQDALELGPSNFSFCPQCDLRVCPMCYQSRLPLTGGSSGFGMCPKCRIAVQRAIIGNYGKVPLLPNLRGKVAQRKKWWEVWK